jgi:cysteinyl-tRNA synthetase
MRTAVEGEADPAVVELLDETKHNFIEKMDDDFNAPAALAVLQDLTRQVNTLLNEKGPLNSGTLTAIDNLYRELGGSVLGIIPEQAEASADAEREEGLIRLLIDLRTQARARKDWAASDQIRDQLKELGVILEDRADGTIWKLE